jgi:glyoxylase-like metal-dependent hydrolase (beta-lactamase superfamily II)
MPELTEDLIRQTLASVKYPGFSRDIVSFGLIKEIRIQAADAVVQMALTTNDPRVPQTIKDHAEAALAALPGIGKATVRIDIQAPAQQPKVVEVEKLKDNLYMLKGGGGNTAVFVMANGITVVDTKNPGWGQPILDKIKEVSPKPVTTIINTHTHGDHVSGNVEFPATVDVVVQQNTKANMEKMSAVTGLGQPGAAPPPNIFTQNNGRGMAKRTFTDKMTLGSGNDQIDLYYFGRGHTNGDAWVVFPALRTAHLGDLFASKGLPLVDGNNGGSVLHYAETLNTGYSAIKNVDTVINGHHNTTTTWEDVKQFADFNQDFLTWAQGALQSGKTPEQAAAEWKVPAKYEGYSPQVAALFGGLPGRIQRLQDEMKK